jgi:hypothetical protein
MLDGVRWSDSIPHLLMFNWIDNGKIALAKDIPSTI